MRLPIKSEENARDALFLIKHELETQAVNESVVSEFVTLSSELLFNVLRHGNEGNAEFRFGNSCAELVVQDQGKGFMELGERAFTEGISSSDGLGLGLSAAVRMADTFALETNELGTLVKVTKQVRHDRV